MSHVRFDQTDGVLHIVLARPERRNALTLEMYAALADALVRANTDSSIRVLLISGEGKTFCAGNDLTSFMQNPDVSEDSSVIRFLRALVACEVPIVAAIHGAAVGIGTTLLLHCDLVYAATGTKLSLPFVNLALVPEGGSSLLLPRMMGHVKAAELLLLGDAFSAEKAAQLGLINDVVEPGDLLAIAGKTAKALAEKPPTALRQTRALLKKAAGSELQATLNEELGHFAVLLSSPEAKEAFTAFAEKRKPDFSSFS